MLGTKILEEGKSKYNGDIKVVRSLGFGIYIQAEGLTQSGGIVGDIWKSTIKKLKNSKIPNIQTVLILGLGGGTVAKLIKKYWKNAKITGVDIDPVMVELGKKYLGLTDDIDIKICDAFNFLIHHSLLKSYDLVIIDLYNGDKYPEKFETEKFIHLVRSHLSRSGVAVFNRLYYGEKRPQAVKFGGKLEKIFSKVTWHYPEANLMFICQK